MKLNLLLFSSQAMTRNRHSTMQGTLFYEPFAKYCWKKSLSIRQWEIWHSLPFSKPLFFPACPWMHFMMRMRGLATRIFVQLSRIIKNDTMLKLPKVCCKLWLEVRKMLCQNMQFNWTFALFSHLMSHMKQNDNDNFS